MCITRDNPGYVSSMSVIVVLAPATDKTLPVNDPRLPPRRAQIGVGIDSTVDDCNADSASVDAQAPGLRSIDGVVRVIQRSIHVPVQGNVAHVRLIGQRDDVAGMK